eukprot:12925216-Prorocentrum_lima.AAC.1
MSGHAHGSISGHAWEALNPVKEGWSSPVKFPEGLPRFGYTANVAAVGILEVEMGMNILGST